jgi:hypothetical protein
MLRGVRSDQEGERERRVIKRIKQTFLTSVHSFLVQSQREQAILPLILFSKRLSMATHEHTEREKEGEGRRGRERERERERKRGSNEHQH